MIDQQDTSQIESSEDVSLDSVFGIDQTSEEVGNTPADALSSEQVNTEQGTPNVSPQQEDYQAKNDAKRFEYWQSKASRLENDMRALQQQSQQQQMQQQQLQQAPPVQEQEEFPPPPEKPVKPRSFSREEAWNDPSSESARYMDSLDEWRDENDQYKDLRSQYETARLSEQIEVTEKRRQDDIQRQQAYYTQQQQVSEAKNLLTGHYGMNEQEAEQFMQTYSDRKSVTMDNLVQLYRLQNGQGQKLETPTFNQPSAAFTQTKRAQQIPSPMGVQGGATPNSGDVTGGQIMSKLVDNYNKENPF